jgi:predicted transcriptional regulator
MKAVLISIRPKWCEMIASGKKTVEVRKSRPKLEPPFKCYIYETRGFERVGNENLNCVVGGNGRGAVIGEFVCDKTYCIEFDYYDNCYNESYTPDGYSDCMSDEEFSSYLQERNGYGLHISNLVIYDEPKQLSDFRLYNTSAVIEDGLPMPTHKIRRPPLSWMYVEELP